jgi:predicted nucleic acid-binding protein
LILVDTSVWIDHFRKPNTALEHLLENVRIVGHPWVTGELALGSLSRRAEIIGLLRALPQATEAHPGEILRLIDQESLHGTGIGYVDAQLLAAARLTPDTSLWTADKRLSAAAVRLGVEFRPPGPSASG